jgi:hypothetical protein
MFDWEYAQREAAIIKHKINRTKYFSWLSLTTSMFGFFSVNLSNKILIKQNQGNNYVRLITILTTKPGIVEQNINQTKSG